MPSPFPGMDPYIEQPAVWGDFHNALATEIRNRLNGLIHPAYFARLIPYVTYETVAIGQKQGTYPDVSLFRSTKPQPLPFMPHGGGAVALLEPPTAVDSEVAIDFPFRQHSVEIYSSVGQELVTVIEILSPVNKQGGHEAYQHYLEKRRHILRSRQVHLVEIDFLRGGQRPPLAHPVPEAPYYIMLSRAETRPRVKVWPIQLHDPLPVVNIPLRHPDPDVSLDLSSAVTAVYELGAYDVQLDYHQEPPPPKLSAEQTSWVQQLLQEYRRLS
ncbi:MAG: DUF4058 family protein [Caldilinea sp. CFX5]|nr:DUF4058 family protein [Caldilinea sp. CFX5]